LTYTSPGNAGLIAQTEVLFTFIFFNVWRKDYISRKQLFGALFMLAGAVIVFLPNVKEFNPGDALITMAMFFAPIGNHFQQKARKEISGETMMFVRSFLSFPVIFLLAIVLGNSISLADLRSSWIAVVINGLVLFGFSKLLWIEGIHRISVTKAIALGGFIPLLTLLLSWLVLGNAPTTFQLLSFFPLFFGVILLTSRKPQQARPEVIE
jgi:drug/metabolite transporter (DMT)-like permease